MAVSKLICPECETTLRPAKPLKAGKKVKCPRCGTTFAAEEDYEDEPEAKPSSKVKSKKPAPRPAAPPPPEKKGGMDYETTTYAVTRDEKDEEEDDADERGDDLVAMYLKESKSADPRGPTQEKITRPTNWLIMTGACGVGGYVILLLALIILFWMPVKDPTEQEDGKKKKLKGFQIGPGVAAVADQLDPLQKEREALAKQAVAGAEAVVGKVLGFIQSLHVIIFFVLSFLLMIGILYGALVIYGAVKAQGMESRTWGIVSSILAMIPINAFGFAIVTLALLTLAASFLYDDLFFIQVLQIIFGVTELAWGVSVGIWNIRTLVDEDVVAGFEYTDEESEGNVV